MIEKFERFFERLLWKSRLIILLAVVASVLSSFIMVLTGVEEVASVIKKYLLSFVDESAYQSLQKVAIVKIVGAIDSFLIATVLLIFGIGLYELFISKIEEAEADNRSSKILVVHSLDQLKEKLAKVILMVLIVVFFKHAVQFRYEDINSLLYLSIGIFLIALSVFLTHGGGKKG